MTEVQKAQADLAEAESRQPVPAETAELLTTVFGPLIPESMADTFGDVSMGVDINGPLTSRDGETFKAAIKVLIANALTKGLGSPPMGWTVRHHDDGAIGVEVITMRTKAKAA